MKHAAVQAFTSENIRIPFEVSLPILTEKLANGNGNERSFAHAVFERAARRFDMEQLAFCYDKLMQWDMEPEIQYPYGPYVLLNVFFRNTTNGNEMILKFLRETIQKNDAKRFQLLFDGETMLEVVEINGVNRLIVPPREPFPRMVEGQLPNVTRGGILQQARTPFQRLTPFGHSLLALLRSEGVVSSNELIRTTSQQVVDALVQIAELE